MDCPSKRRGLVVESFTLHVFNDAFVSYFCLFVGLLAYSACLDLKIKRLGCVLLEKYYDVLAAIDEKNLISSGV